MSGKVKEICRTCLSGRSSLLPLSASFEPNVTVADYFRIYLNYEFAYAKELPAAICLKCLDTLLMIKQFHTQCKESEEYLEKKHQLNLNELNDYNVEDFYDEDETDLNNSINKTGEKAFASEEDFKDEDFIYFNRQLESENKKNLEKAENHVEYKCKDCGECFDSSSVINEHWQLYHEPREDFSEEREDKSHLLHELETEVQDPLNRLEDENNFYCNKCKKSFDYEDVFEEHMAKHEYQSLTTKCTKCNKTFSGSKSLRKHFMQIHLQFMKKLQKNHECQECGKKFLRKTQLVIHERQHTGERPFKCTYCGKGFTQKNCLVTHLTLHTGKTIKCPLCDKRYSRKSFLTVHIRCAHNKYKPFICDKCPKRFFQTTHLRDHQLTHTGERPFSCNICNKSYYQRSVLESHMFSHGRPKPFKCYLCSKEFIKPYLYRKHMLTVHNIEEDVTQSRTIKMEITQEQNENYDEFEICKDEFIDNHVTIEETSTEERNNL